MTISYDSKFASDMPPPMAVPTAPPSRYDAVPESEHVYEQLLQQGFSRGLARALINSKDAFAMRFWIVDNSGSMLANDGHRLVDATPSHRRDYKARFVVPSFYTVNCSRWEEIRETVLYHVRLAELMKAPTRFRLLNPRTGMPPVFSIADNAQPTHSPVTSEQAKNFLYRIQPGGGTPLTRHIQEIRQEVVTMLPQLEATGRRVAVVIATDGLPTSSRGGSAYEAQDDFLRALKSLEGLPVWIVIRLCTDEHQVTDFYNRLDSQLEFSVEVLDDYCGEAEEVQSLNPWLNYGLPLHRAREMGSNERLLDLLDERPLSSSEVASFCRFLFGEDVFDGFPDPAVHWRKFVAQVEKTLLPRERLQWNPVVKKALPWINLHRVHRRETSEFGLREVLCLCLVLLIAVFLNQEKIDLFVRMM